MANNFHSNAFDDATQLKLEIYEKYLMKWLPVFVEGDPNKNWNGTINIFDFFCGPGKDKNGNFGSPLVAVRACEAYLNTLRKEGKSINLYFSDARQRKIAELKKYLNEEDFPDEIKWEAVCKKFRLAFMNKLGKMYGSANLLFIDQCGISGVDQNVFKALIGLRGTDFLFYIASSYFKRFRTSEQFKRYLDVSEFIDDSTLQADSHRAIAAMYRSLIPSNVKYYLAPFSFKKGGNIYGLIFGSGHLLGILKFLEVAWSLDKERGEANFDIDRDNLPKPLHTLDLFKDNNNANKVVIFQEGLEKLLMEKHFKSDLDIFKYSLENGFLPTKHAKATVEKLIKSGHLSFDSGKPRLSKICIKEPRNIINR